MTPDPNKCLPAPWWLAIHAGWLSELPARALAHGCSANVTGDVALFLGCSLPGYQRLLLPAVARHVLLSQLPAELAEWVYASWIGPSQGATPEQMEDILDRATWAAVEICARPMGTSPAPKAPQPKGWRG